VNPQGVRAVDRPDPTKPLAADESLGELFGDLTRDVGEFFSTQIELAKLELREEAARAGKGAAFLGGGAVALHLAVALVSVAVAFGLAALMPDGFAFLIVGIVWLAIGAALAVNGRTQFRLVRPVPETQKSLKEDMAWIRQLKS
jgi:uncharacterized membrane protein YqjE